MFGERRRIRLGPAFFPFVEPGCEVGVSCFRCDGAGCRVCGTGWIELLGAGMVHPVVLENCGYDPERYTGFAFGLGIERVALLALRDPRHPHARRRRRPVPGAVPRGRMRIVWSWLREFCPDRAHGRRARGAADPARREGRGGAPPVAGRAGGRRRAGGEGRGPSELRDAQRGHHRRRGRRARRGAPACATTRRAISCRGRRPGSRVPVLAEPLAPRKLRGVVSNGMLCSPRELAIADVHTGILVLNDEGVAVGDDVVDALGLDDEVLDIEVEPNRPDFLSVIGVAREVAALTGAPLVDPLPPLEESDEPASDVAPIRIDALDGCPRYVARVVRGLGRGATPVRAQARLTACGMRPISPVVDATNYAMLELGQPLARLRPVPARGTGHRGAPRDRGGAAHDPRRRRARVVERRPADLRRRAAGRDRRCHGRGDLGGAPRTRPTCCSSRRPSRGPASCARRAGSTCTPRRPIASSAGPIRRRSRRGRLGAPS